MKWVKNKQKIDKTDWHLWFAWKPVVVHIYPDGNEKVAFLTTVLRRVIYRQPQRPGMEGTWETIYKERPKQSKFDGTNGNGYQPVSNTWKPLPLWAPPIDDYGEEDSLYDTRANCPPVELEGDLSTLTLMVSGKVNSDVKPWETPEPKVGLDGNYMLNETEFEDDECMYPDVSNMGEAEPSTCLNCMRQHDTEDIWVNGLCPACWKAKQPIKIRNCEDCGKQYIKRDSSTICDDCDLKRKDDWHNKVVQAAHEVVQDMINDDEDTHMLPTHPNYNDNPWFHGQGLTCRVCNVCKAVKDFYNTKDKVCQDCFDEPHPCSVCTEDNRPEECYECMEIDAEDTDSEYWIPNRKQKIKEEECPNPKGLRDPDAMEEAFRATMTPEKPKKHEIDIAWEVKNARRNKTIM